MERVAPSYISSTGLWNIFSQKKTYTITCGKCSHHYTDKVSFAHSDEATSPCPACHILNVWSHNAFAAMYRAQTEAKSRASEEQ